MIIQGVEPAEGEGGGTWRTRASTRERPTTIRVYKETYSAPSKPCVFSQNSLPEKVSKSRDFAPQKSHPPRGRRPWTRKVGLFAKSVPGEVLNVAKADASTILWLTFGGALCLGRNPFRVSRLFALPSESRLKVAENRRKSAIRGQKTAFSGISGRGEVIFRTEEVIFFIFFLFTDFRFGERYSARAHCATRVCEV